MKSASAVEPLLWRANKNFALQVLCLKNHCITQGNNGT